MNLYDIVHWPKFPPGTLAQASAWLFQCRCSSTQMERNIGSYKNRKQDWWNDLPSVVTFTNHQNKPIQTWYYSCANFFHNASSHHTQLSGPRVVKDDLVMHSQQISVLATVCGSAITIHSLWFHIFLNLFDMIPTDFSTTKSQCVVSTRVMVLCASHMATERKPKAPWCCDQDSPMIWNRIMHLLVLNMEVGSESWCAKEGLGGVGLNLKWGLVLLPYIEDGDGSFPLDHLQLQWWTSITSRHYGCEKQEIPSTGQNAPRSWSQIGPMKTSSVGGVLPPQFWIVALFCCQFLWSCCMEWIRMVWISKTKEWGAYTGRIADAPETCQVSAFWKERFDLGEAWDIWDGQPVSRSKNCPLDQRFTRFCKQNIWHNIDIWWLAAACLHSTYLVLCITIARSICCTEFHVCCRSEVSSVWTNSMFF